jgi:hypothetical protein
MGASGSPPITPEMKVGELLDAYPQLEATLIAQAPAFANLRNPVLRRTVAKVATLAQAARIGGVDVRALVRTLRQAAGQDVDGAVDAGVIGDEPQAAPQWYDERLVVATLDADAMLAKGEHPLGEVQRLAGTLTCHSMVCLDSGFVPAPLVDAFRKQGFEVATFGTAPGRYRTAIRRVQTGSE